MEHPAKDTANRAKDGTENAADDAEDSPDNSKDAANKAHDHRERNDNQNDQQDGGCSATRLHKDLRFAHFISKSMQVGVGFEFSLKTRFRLRQMGETVEY